MRTTLYGKVLEKLLAFMCASLLLLMFIIFVNMYAPTIESNLMPVVREFKVSELTMEDSRNIVIKGTFIQLRSECKMDGIVAYTTDKHRITKELAAVELLGADKDSITYRITGKQTWGPWKIHPESSIDGGSLIITSYHDCHDFYLTPTQLVIMDLPEVTHPVTKIAD